MHCTHNHGLDEKFTLIALLEEMGCGFHAEVCLLVFRQYVVSSIERGDGLRGEGSVHGC